MISELIPIKPTPGWVKLCVCWVIVITIVSACGGDGGDEQPTPDDPLAAEGQRVFDRNCANCHSFDEGKVMVGPSLDGIASRAPTRIDGLNASEYLDLAITNPSTYQVDGFNDLMPSNFQQLLSSSEIEAVIAFLLTFE